MTAPVSGYHFEELKEGMSESSTRTIKNEDIQNYADLSGDHNPIHLDDAYAKNTQFKGCIAHGMLTIGYISALFGMKLPGPGAIYLSQSIRFRAAVKAGDEVESTVTVKELIPEKRVAIFKTVCKVAGKRVITGEAEIFIPEK